MKSDRFRTIFERGADYDGRKGEAASCKKDKKRVILIIVVLCVVAGAAFYGGVRIDRNRRMREFEEVLSPVSETPAILRETGRTVTINQIKAVLLPASDLITTRYYYTDADIAEDFSELIGIRIPFTTNKTIFTYDGVISVGVDLSAAEYALDNAAKTITITLPQLKIVANEIDMESFRYYDVATSLFNRPEMGDTTELLASLKRNKADELNGNRTFFDQARNNTQSVLRGLLNASEDMRDYTVIFEYR